MPIFVTMIKTAFNDIKSIKSTLKHEASEFIVLGMMTNDHNIDIIRNLKGHKGK